MKSMWAGKEGGAVTCRGCKGSGDCPRCKGDGGTGEHDRSSTSIERSLDLGGRQRGIRAVVERVDDRIGTEAMLASVEVGAPVIVNVWPTRCVNSQVCGRGMVKSFF